MEKRGPKRKYENAEIAKLANKKSTIKGRYFFLTLPALECSDEEVENLKLETFKSMVQVELKHRLEHLGVVREHHLDGSLHMHVYVQYEKAVEISLKHFNYLIKHPNIQRVKSLKHVLDYFIKQDLHGIYTHGFNPLYEVNKLSIQREPYELLQKAMLSDPFNFESHKWFADNNLSVAASKGNWPKAIALVKKQQQVEASRMLTHTCGMRDITREFISQVLSPDQLIQYRSWSGYQNIVDFLNEISKYGFNRPHKSKNLLIVGRPNIGKTALARKIRDHIAVYSFGVENWFPRYQNWIYPMIFWNQFYLRAMPYGQLLNVLEGEPVDLPFKGGSVLKKDNQLVYITSNMSLQQHICNRFKKQDSRALSRANLTARIHQIIVPKNKDLFLLLKLIKPLD